MGDENNDTPPTKRFKKAYADLIRDSTDSQINMIWVSI